MAERDNDLHAFSDAAQSRIIRLCRRKNSAAKRLDGRHPRPCVDSGLCCFECQDEAIAQAPKGTPDDE